MSDLDESVDRPIIPESAPSPGRRRLLKAAAAGTPLIATLPSGAVFANASTAQCLAKNLADTHDGTIGPIETSADQYLRVAGCEVNVAITNPQNTFQNPYYAKKQGDICPGYDDSTKTITDTSFWFNANGDVMPDSANLGVDPVVIDGPNDVNLLQIYLVDDPAMPTSNAELDPNYYPKVQIDSDDGNTGLSATCLCSVNPGLDPGRLCS